MEIRIRSTAFKCEPMDERFGRISENDSKEEAYFDWWAKELLEAGLLKNIYLPEQIVIDDAVRLHYRKLVRKKPTWKTKNLLNEIKYTADRLLEWSDEAKGLLFKQNFVNENDDVIVPLTENHDAYFYAFKYGESYWSVIDIKPPRVGPHNTSGITFPIKQHMMLRKTGIHVQKTVLYPSGKVKATKSHLFNATFTPKRFLLTDKSGKPRSIKFQITNYRQWLTLIHSTSSK